MKRIVPILLLASRVAVAGNGSVDGTIVEETGKVAAHVAIQIACGAVNKTATTDAAGHFSIAGLPEGQCVLTTAAGTYMAVSLGVTIAPDAIATILVNVMTKAGWERQRAEQERSAKEAAVMAPSAAVPEAPMPMPHRAPPRPLHMAPKRDLGGGGVAVGAAPPPPAKPVKLDAVNKPPPMANRRIRAAGPMAIGGEQVNGWATVRVFPVPQYTKEYDGPRDDFRETIYWNGDVETDASGDADVMFAVSDAVTSFRATAEGFGAGGIAGGGTATFQSKLPVTLDAHLPTEVTSGDTIQLPVTIANETDEAIDASVDAKFGAAFRLAQNPISGPLHLKAKEKQSVVYPLEVIATEGRADVDVELASRGLHDEIKKTIRVVPKGFPFEASASGTAKTGATAHHTVDLAGAMPGTIHATVTMYPSPVAAMTQGMAAMIREPGGCFEQTSATNYPNTMILAYLESNEAADPALVQTARGKLDKGYKLLTGYETPQKGYEWFGQTPGHEALTAYGLMEFADMAKVYDVDRKMVERTADWLMSRRDQKGGFMRSTAAIDSFGRAGEATTNAYIVWALSEARRTQNLGKELGVQRSLGESTKDPYLLALASNTALVEKDDAGVAMVKRLAGMQGKDGSFGGAKESITMSGGESLAIETTSLATLALIKASPNNEYETQIRGAVDWLNTKRGGYGAWGNTQATVLGLKALTAYSEHARQMQSGGSATLIINGKPAGTIQFDKGRREALVWNDVANKLAPGKNSIELKLDGPGALPYSIAIDYRAARPQSSPRTKVAVTTQLLKTQAKMGEGVTLRAHVENTTTAGIPMTLARIGLPGGMVFQTWQLKELRDKGIIDFYETRPREVILYWRGLAPSSKKDVDLNLLANTPGTYEAPASSAYLYYTAEDKAWTAPVSIAIDR